jgi:hypothetical protein
MRQDRPKWNEKYQNQHCSDEPAAIVKQFAGLAGGKNALDIAAGNGRFFWPGRGLWWMPLILLM